jgi:hypothetical protein
MPITLKLYGREAGEEAGALPHIWDVLKIST